LVFFPAFLFFSLPGFLLGGWGLPVRALSDVFEPEGGFELLGVDELFGFDDLVGVDDFVGLDDLLEDMYGCVVYM